MRVKEGLVFVFLTLNVLPPAGICEKKLYFPTSPHYYFADLRILFYMYVEILNTQIYFDVYCFQKTTTQSGGIV